MEQELPRELDDAGPGPTVLRRALSDAELKTFIINIQISSINLFCKSKIMLNVVKDVFKQKRKYLDNLLKEIVSRN